jgi:hypothetical protein
MRTLTAGRLLIEKALPPRYRRQAERLDSKGLQALLQTVATEQPDSYREVVHALLQAGDEAAAVSGGLSFGLDDLITPPGVDAIRRRVHAEVDMIRRDPRLRPEEKSKRVVAVLQAAMKPLEDAAFDEPLRADNPLAHQVAAGVRGKKMNLRSLLAGDILYADHRDRPVAVPILSDYAKGLTPVEYFAGAFGARKGVVDLKAGTAKAGYWSKSLTNTAHDLVVVGEDHEDDEVDRSHLGLPASTGDLDLVGRLLARPAGGYTRNTVLSREVLADLRRKGHERILVRSPIVGGPAHGGLFARDLGVRERGGLPPRGDFVGIASGQSIGERVSQNTIGSKHSGGVVGANATTSGFAYLNNLINPPKAFPGAATHAQTDGVVERIREAPQGGHYVRLKGVDHYVPASLDVAVAPGDTVEAGDALSNGVPNPAELVKHKGIGEGRRRFVAMFAQALADAGVPAEKANVEVVARGLIDHVRVREPIGDLPVDDVMPYSRLEAGWEPRTGTRALAPRAAVGKYLERPVLHYTIGTPIRPSMVAELEAFGIRDVQAHDDPVPFEPLFVRAVDAMQHHPDWMTRHLGSNVQKSTLDAAHLGLESDPDGTSYVPAVIERVTFGRHGATRAWGPRDGDGDGYVEDGTPRMRKVSRLLDLGS